MASSPLPAGRYGSRARGPAPRWVRWLAVAAGLAAALGIAILAYSNFGRAPIQGEQTAFRLLDAQSVSVTVEVQRTDPERPAACVVRARAKDGDEVGRKEMLIRPSQGTIRVETVVRTSRQAVIGEVYGCTYNVPEYLSNTIRPTG